MSTTIKITPTSWNLSSIWNNAAMKENRDLQKRDYIYASEIGMPFCDRWLKMKAEPYTNPPNNRSLRKFLAGNVWEYVTKQILIACGVFRREEVKIDAQPYAGMLDVHGRCDFIAGGYIDEEIAMIRVRELNLPDFLFVVAERIIAALHGRYLEEKILELKAVSTFAMDKVERMGAPMPNHTLQGYHYQKNSNGTIQAAVSYICKDDCRMAQFDVNGETTESIYKSDIEQMTDLFKKRKCPKIEPLSSFDYTLGKFSKNFGVEYSPYLTKLYGFETPDDYRQSVSFIEKWNRTLTRMALIESGAKTPTGKPIAVTTKNIECMEEINKAGFKFDDLLKVKVELGELEEETEI
jgi:hypothetical protein